MPALTPPPGDATQQDIGSAAAYIVKYGKGQWRTARKTHNCRHWWNTECVGTGEIAAGERYFDTQELDGSAGGFGTHRCCKRCAEEQEVA